MTGNAAVATTLPASNAAGSYESWYPSLWRRAYGVAYQFLGSRAAAEDAAQETMARAYAWWHRIKGPPGGWVARVAYNVAVEQVRRRPVTSEWSDAANHIADPAADPVRAERLDLQLCLARLPRRQREVVVLRYLADQTEHDTAATLGLSVSTVRKHATNGLAALRTAMALPHEGS